MVEKPPYEELAKKIRKLEKYIDRQKQAENSLLHRAKLETLISDISTSFINIPSKSIDETIRYSLRLLGKFADADRCYVFLISDDGLKLDNTHEWCGKGIESHINNLKNLPIDIYPWWMNKLKNKESIIISRVDDLPLEASAEKEVLQSQDIRSIVAVPMVYKDELVGFLGFDFVKKETPWKNEDTLLLRTTGNIFISALKQKEIEENLIEKENRLRTILKNLPGDVIVHDLEGKILLVNDEACKVKGYPEEDLLNMSIQDLDPETVTRNDRENVWYKLKPGKAVNFESISVRKDGSQYVSEVYLNAAELEGLPVIIAISFDISEHKRLLEMLAQSAEMERLISEISSEFVGLSSNRIDEGIDRALASLGAFSGADRAYVFLFQEDNELVDNTHEWCAEGVKPDIGDFKNRALSKYHPMLIEHILKHEVFNVPDVETIPDEFSVEREHFKANDVKSVIAVSMKLDVRIIGFIVLHSLKRTRNWSKDVQLLLRVAGETLSNAIERKRAEKRLRESEEKLARSKKMESLGLLAGGVAHDLNNVLSGIVSYPELLLLDLPQNSTLRKPIQTILESGNRAVAIVQDLLTIARGVASPKEPLNLNTIIKEYLKSPEFINFKQYYPDIRVRTDLDTELLNINGSPIHLRKIIMNLVSNASEAIENKGIIKISTCNRYLDRPLRGYEDVNEGEYTILSVSDNGPGIPDAFIERIFEPFFTKKHIGRSGTGLGLAVVWNILQDHEGYVNVSSDSKGTIFELYFPITRSKIYKKDMSISITELKGNGENILVVDDIESQREITCSILSALGYKCVAVSCGEDAVDYLKDNPVDMVLLDMIMDPGINGRETYNRLKKIRPNQKALIVSGMAETDEVKKAQALGAGQYVKKPLTLERIGLAIKKELGG